MKLKIAFILVSLFCFSSVPAQEVQTGKSNAPAKNSSQEIKKLEQVIASFDEALIMRNTEALKRIVADNLQMVHSNGMVETKATLMQHLEEGALQYKTIVGGENYKTAITAGTEATVTRDLDVTGVLNGDNFDVKLVTVEEWSKAEGDWKLIKRQSKNRK